MSNRLDFISHSIKSEPKFVDSSFDFLDFASLLTPEQNTIRKNLRTFLEAEVKDAIIPFVESATFPQPIIKKLGQTGIMKHFLAKPYGHGGNVLTQGLIISQLARIDTGLATFAVVQVPLLGFTVQALGSQQQKAKYLPKIANLEWIGAWGLTQDKIGSDASNLETTVTKTSDGYLLNGVKRWMGNANKDLLIVWAKNEKKQVNGFILQTHNNPKGWKSEVIKNKIGVRIVQNCHVTLDNVFVKEQHKLPLAKNFQQGTSVILKHSRIIVCWIALGTCIGVYDNAIKYTRERKQFGKPIASFQLVQEKLVRIMAYVQAMLMLMWRISGLHENKTLKMSQITLAKSWITQRGRQVCRLGREICGGNGLLHENYVMRALTDMEGIYTYQGTYEMNTLVTGRDLTGYSAFGR